MKRHISSITAALASFILTAAIIPFTVHAQTPIQVVRTGDRELSCTALAAEINTLGQPAPVAAAKPRKRGFGFLKVLGAAVPMVGMVGGLAGGVASGVASSAVSHGMEGDAQAQMANAQDMARDAMNGGSLVQQRKDRLTAIFDEKRC